MIHPSRRRRWFTVPFLALLALTSIAARPEAMTLRGTVYNDANCNAKRDPDEGPIVDARIQVSTPDLSFVQEYRSGSDGTFGPALSEGSFNVRLIVPDGWTLTTQPSTYSVFVQQGQAVLGLDFGISQTKCAARPGTATGSAAKPGTLPATGGEPADAGPDFWPLFGVWLAIAGMAFIAVTTLAPRARRK